MSEKGTEQGTPQRKQKAKDKGDVVRSRELLSAFAMMAGVVVLGAVTRNFVSGWAQVYGESLHSAAIGQAVDEQSWGVAIRKMLAPALLPVGMVMTATFAGALISGLAQGGGVAIHPEAIGFKFSKLSPIKNLGHIFSLRGATRLAKSMVPAAVMLLFGWAAIKALMVPLPVMSLLRLPNAFSTTYSLALDAAWVTLIWSGLDYAVEWMAWNKRMKVSKQELKDEMKESLGNPQIKMRIRQAQNAMRRRRVKADISRASVVITNPTHYAVALEFSFDTMQAPTVLAKGRDLHAAEIREEARWAGIPMIENAPLARSLYKAVEPGQTIPFELYAAVAGILAFLYRQKVEQKVREDKAREAQAREQRATNARYRAASAPSPVVIPSSSIPVPPASGPRVETSFGGGL